MAMEMGNEGYSNHEFEFRLTGPRFNFNLSVPVMFLDKPVVVESTHGNVIDVGQNTTVSGSLLDSKSTPKTGTSTARNYVRNGGGKKPASESQKDFLKKLADEKNVDVDALIRERFNKTMDMLVGEEANALIQNLKGTRI